MLPLFKSHFSIGRSILTLDLPDAESEGGSDSIFKIAVENNINPLILVEDSFSGFLQAKKNSEELGLQLIFGLRMSIAQDIEEKPTKDNRSEHKIIIFAKNDQGIKALYKIYNLAFSKGYGHLDYNNLKLLWSEDLKLAVPFYDSFIFINLMKFSNCVPDFTFCKPVFFTEDNGLPFDKLVLDALSKYCDQHEYETENVKSIYYKNKDDLKAFQTYKCLCNRGFSARGKTLSEPNLDHFGSDEFCFESWKTHEG